MKRLLRILVLVGVCLQLFICQRLKSIHGTPLAGNPKHRLTSGIEQTGFDPEKLLSYYAISPKPQRYIDQYMDQMASEIDQVLPFLRIKRNAGGIVLTFSQDWLFEKNQHQLQTTKRERLDGLSQILFKYHLSDLYILGVGSTFQDPAKSSYHNHLRVKSMITYFAGEGILFSRMLGIGLPSNKIPDAVDAKNQTNSILVVVMVSRKMEKLAKKAAKE